LSEKNRPTKFSVNALRTDKRLTLGWYAITFGSFGLVRLDGATIDKVFLNSPGGPYLFWVMAVVLSPGVHLQSS
jgi:hypothetical protein